MLGFMASEQPALQQEGVLELAVIVPVLNEVGNIRKMVDALGETLGAINWEVIFVDDGSTDGTIAEIDTLALCHRHVRAIKRYNRKGLASAVVDGAMSTAAPVVAVIDGDMQHDERHLPAMYRAIAEDRSDMVIGTRYSGGGTADGFSATRLRGSLAVTRFTNVIMRTRCSDPMSGFFAIRRDRLVEVQPRLSGIGFKIMLDILVSSRQGFRVTEQPYDFRSRQSGDSKMSAKVLIDLFVFFIDKTAGRILPTRLILFLMVGTLGVLVHLAVLRAVLGLGHAFPVAQTMAVLVAIAFNFALNNMVTYASQRLRGWAMVKGLLSFYLVCGTGALANIGVGSLMFNSHSTWWLAGIAGGATGAIWNYAASSLLTWRMK
ncbi:glycosyltransferase family 2 protein [Sphingobium sufflavum]|uniref:glycosyltransferase family 2 protein n=1 Tax=Sphingobium sufflavum TaxID=1129547 RepID=UPI001F4311C9|nr:glycosyltransferase family 2 protein [Sphingobium sufflavum]MCE7797916.1 glycosyltransferase family 2 protein [Sphingobium sufflavum]